jgi:hypothetical protein
MIFAIFGQAPGDNVFCQKKVTAQGNKIKLFLDEESGFLLIFDSFLYL